MPIVGGPGVPPGGVAVPSDGTFANANWAEVFYTDHDYTGHTILTNGLLLLDFSAGVQKICDVYLWSAGLATPAWQLVGNLDYQDNAITSAFLRSITPIRIGTEEAAIKCIASTAAGQAAQVIFRLQRGRFEARVDFTPLTQSNTHYGSLVWNLPANPKILYNSAKVVDQVIETASNGPAFQTDYGYGAAFVNSTSYPFIGGFLYQNQVARQPSTYFPASAFIGLGDTSGPSVGAQRSYGFFAIPYGINASYSTANLQAEAESGTLGTGWTSQAGAGGNSNALEAKCASGTVATNADTFGTAFVPAVGTYDVWFRVKVTTNVGSNAEMTLGLWNSTDSVFVGSTTFNRTAMTTSYVWYRAAAGVTPTAGKAMRFQAVTALTLGTDWFIDEACMVPLTLTTDSRGPQQLATQFQYDRSTKLIRP